MLNHVRGVLTAREPTRVVVDVNGVGYEAQVSLSASRRLPPVGQTATLLLHLMVKEDDLRLIGFVEEDERATYRRLIRLSGVGPAMALQILSAMTPQEFAAAVERQDAAALKRVKGIGDKLAKRIILELKGAKARISALAGTIDGDPSAPGAGGTGAAGVAADAMTALEAMGMSSREAEDRVARVLSRQPDLTLETLIVAALK